MIQTVGRYTAPVLFLIMILSPVPESMDPLAMRTAAVAVWMAVWWMTEAIPISATALLPIVLLPVLGILPAGEVTRQYGHPIIFLFMGGFLVAVTMERWNLHRRLALSIIRCIGTEPKRLILGFMSASALLSMWVSNTATALMMVPIGMAVVKQTDAIPGLNSTGRTSNFSIAIMLGIAYACSIGGVATIIGTPPNTVLAGVADTLFGVTISFGRWMLFGLPLALIMLVFSWVYLVFIAFPPGNIQMDSTREALDRQWNALGRMSREELTIFVVFTTMATAWILNGFIHVESLSFVNDSTIAMAGAILLFLIPSRDSSEALLDWETASSIPWGILVLFGGGLALAHSFTTSGLAEWIAERLMFLEGQHLWVLLLALATLTLFLTEITSNTATSTMLMPVLASMAAALLIHPYALMVAAAIASSFAFMLPVATPPNAVVFGSGRLTIPQMARAGFWLNIIGIVVITVMVYFLLPVVWQIDLEVYPF
ncbi:MAG: SLC13 family permease [Balneolaceae bacterium]